MKKRSFMRSSLFVDLEGDSFQLELVECNSNLAGISPDLLSMLCDEQL